MNRDKVIKGSECCIKYVNEFSNCSVPSDECPYEKGVDKAFMLLIAQMIAKVVMPSTDWCIKCKEAGADVYINTDGSKSSFCDMCLNNTVIKCDE